jgi:hypothetical protein
MSIEARLERLERSNRRLRLGVAAMVAVAVVAVLAGQQAGVQAQPDAIQRELAETFPALAFQDHTLEQVFGAVDTLHPEIGLEIDWPRLHALGVRPDTIVTVSVPEARLDETLAWITGEVSGQRGVDVDWSAMDGRVVVTTGPHLTRLGLRPSPPRVLRAEDFEVWVGGVRMYSLHDLADYFIAGNKEDLESLKAQEAELVRELEGVILSMRGQGAMDNPEQRRRAALRDELRKELADLRKLIEAARQ